MKKQQKLFGAKILAYVALSLALIVVGGFIKIPLPVPIVGVMGKNEHSVL